MKKIRKKHVDYSFMASSRFGQMLADHLSWGVDRMGRKVQMYDQEGFVFDLDRKGRIVRMWDSEGHKFKCQ